MLNYDPELKANYELYQELLRAMQNRDFNVLENILERKSSTLISSYMRTSLKTLRKHLPYIKNSFVCPYNNGRIEGINNKIKVLNRVARSEEHTSELQSRFDLVCRLLLEKKKKNN